MSPALFLFASESIALGLLTLAILVSLVRVVAGPTLADRIVALDLLTVLAVSVIGVFALQGSMPLSLDIALALCLVGFVSTVALARYLLTLSKATGVALERQPDRGQAP